MGENTNQGECWDALLGTNMAAKKATTKPTTRDTGRQTPGGGSIIEQLCECGVWVVTFDLVNDRCASCAVRTMEVELRAKGLVKREVPQGTERVVARKLLKTGHNTEAGPSGSGAIFSSAPLPRVLAVVRWLNTKVGQREVRYDHAGENACDPRSETYWSM